MRSSDKHDSAPAQRGHGEIIKKPGNRILGRISFDRRFRWAGRRRSLGSANRFHTTAFPVRRPVVLELGCAADGVDPEGRVAVVVGAVGVGVAFVRHDRAVAIGATGRADAGFFETVAVQLR